MMKTVPRAGLVLLFASGICFSAAVGWIRSAGEVSAVVEEASRKGYPELRPTPLRLQLHDDLANIVDNRALTASLALVEPRWFVWDPALASHALRLWGKDARFPRSALYPVPHDSPPIPGRDLLAFFLREDAFRSHVREKRVEPYFVISPEGWTERRGRDVYSASHRDEFLSVAAEIGLPVTEPLAWHRQVFQIKDILSYSFQWYHPEQELEFTAVAYAHYLPRNATWQDRFGQRFGFTDLAEHLLRRNPREAACYGTHHAYALAVLWSADHDEHLFDAATRFRVRDRLLEYAYDLERTQLGDGSWPHNWSSRLPTGQALESTQNERIRTTGHHLEWLALLPPEFRPKRESLGKAVRYLCKTMPTLDSKRINSALDYAPWSHAARGLLVCQGKRLAGEVMEAEWAKRATPNVGREAAR